MIADWEVWVSAGTGPIEARRMVPLLIEMLARVCEDAGLELLAKHEQREESPRSLCLRVRGDAEATGRSPPTGRRLTTVRSSAG